MRRARLPRLLLAVLASLAIGSVAVAAESRSANVRQVAKLYPQGVDIGAPYDFVFQKDLLVSTIYAPPGTPLLPEQTNGLAIFRISKDDSSLRQISFYRCDGARHVGVWRRWAFVGVLDETTDWAQSRNDNTHTSSVCNNTDDSTGKQGLRIVDISDPRRPRQVRFVETNCGVGALTLVPSGRELFIYSNSHCPDTVAENPAMNGTFGDLEVIAFDPRRPERARVAAVPDITPMEACMENTYFAPRKLLVCPFVNRFILMDASDPANPRPLGEPRVLDQTQSLRGSNFTWDGQFLVLADAAEVVTTPANRSCSGDTSAALYFFNVEDPTDPVLTSRWILERDGASQCMPMNLQVLPSRSRYLVSVSYGASGFSIVDFTDPSSPREVAHFDPRIPSIYNAYWYRGLHYAGQQERVVGTEAQPEWRKGALRVFRLSGRLRDALEPGATRMNVRTQVRL